MSDHHPEARREAARRHEELAASARRHEAEQAQQLIDDFVRRARERGIDPGPLQATLYSGRRVRTPLVGWYLNNAQTLAIGDDGRYYSLVTPGSVLARFTGVAVGPSEPSLVVGRGARDGESGDLTEFLERRLAQG